MRREAETGGSKLGLGLTRGFGLGLGWSCGGVGDELVALAAKGGGG